MTDDKKPAPPVFDLFVCLFVEGLLFAAISSAEKMTESPESGVDLNLKSIDV